MNAGTHSLYTFKVNHGACASCKTHLSFKWMSDLCLMDMDSMTVKDMQGTARGYMHPDACIVDIQVHCTCKLILGVVCMCEALYPLHAASDIDSCTTNRAWMPQ
jgi:hypothetical protein